MRTFISDIFGKTPELEKLAESLSEDVEIIDPYAGEFIPFANESEAYDYFKENVGIDRYCEVVRNRLEQSPCSMLIGFSVGATVIWLLSADPSLKHPVKAACFYGSQIRHYPDIEPGISIELILPCYEPDFSVFGLAQKLSEKPNVTIHITAFRHGFMNPRSQNYHHAGFQQCVQWLKAGAGTDFREFSPV